MVLVTWSMEWAGGGQSPDGFRLRSLKRSDEAALDTKTLKTVRDAEIEPPTVPVCLGLGDIPGMRHFQCPNQESPGPTGASCLLCLHKTRVS